MGGGVCIKWEFGNVLRDDAAALRSVRVLPDRVGGWTGGRRAEQWRGYLFGGFEKEELGSKQRATGGKR